MEGKNVHLSLILVGARVFCDRLDHVPQKVASAGLNDFKIRWLVKDSIELWQLIPLEAPIIIVAVGRVDNILHRHLVFYRGR
jgi:hypothetical protein